MSKAVEFVSLPTGPSPAGGRGEQSRRVCFALTPGPSPAGGRGVQSRRVFYAFFTPRPRFTSRPFTPPVPTISRKRQSPYDGEISMHLLDGLSLLLASGLFIYLLVALLRAGRS